MLICAPLFLSTSMKASPVNCEPWSVLKISGVPYRRSASSSTSTQKLASSVFDNRQESTMREYQSIIATQYTKPCAIGMYVMSVDQIWLARTTSTLRSRYGYFLCAGCGRLVERRG